jgi:hypothetical protein
MNKPTSVKLELTEKQLNMMVYMLGAIDLRSEPETIEVALDLRKKLSNALEIFKPKNNPKKDKYGKVIPEQENAQDVADKFATPQAEVEEKV